MDSVEELRAGSVEVLEAVTLKTDTVTMDSPLNDPWGPLLEGYVTRPFYTVLFAFGKDLSIQSRTEVDREDEVEREPEHLYGNLYGFYPTTIQRVTHDFPVLEGDVKSIGIYTTNELKNVEINEASHSDEINAIEKDPRWLADGKLFCHSYEGFEGGKLLFGERQATYTLHPATVEFLKNMLGTYEQLEQQDKFPPLIPNLLTKFEMGFSGNCAFHMSDAYTPYQGKFRFLEVSQK